MQLNLCTVDGGLSSILDCGVQLYDFANLEVSVIVVKRGSVQLCTAFVKAALDANLKAQDLLFIITGLDGQEIEPAALETLGNAAMEHHIISPKVVQANFRSNRIPIVIAINNTRRGRAQGSPIIDVEC